MSQVRRWYEFSLRGMLADCKAVIRCAIWANPTDPKPHRFQVSLRGAIVAIVGLALSVGLIRQGWSLDYPTDLLWLFGGANVFMGTIGAAIERLSDSRRRGTIGALIANIPVWLFAAYVCLLLYAFKGIEHMP